MAMPASGRYRRCSFTRTFNGTILDGSKGKTVHPKGQHVLAPGDRVTLSQPGGGGFGPARERPREKVIADVRNGYVTPQGAKRDYGVEEEG